MSAGVVTPQKKNLSNMCALLKQERLLLHCEKTVQRVKRECLTEINSSEFKKNK